MAMRAHQYRRATEADGHCADHSFGLANIVYDAIAHGDYDKRNALFLD